MDSSRLDTVLVDDAWSSLSKGLEEKDEVVRQRETDQSETPSCRRCLVVVTSR